MKVYLIGSLKDPDYPKTAHQLRAAGHIVLDYWRGSGRDGDREWKNYEAGERGLSYTEALNEPFAANAYEFDLTWLEQADVVVAVPKPNKLPGSSSVAELGYANLKLRKSTYVLMNGEPDDWELMLQLVVDMFCPDMASLLVALAREEQDCFPPGENVYHMPPF